MSHNSLETFDQAPQADIAEEQQRSGIRRFIAGSVLVATALTGAGVVEIGTASEASAVDQSGFLAEAHRGAPNKHTNEDTSKSEIRAFNRGAVFGEADIQVTKDHVPVVMHDSTTNRESRNCNKSIPKSYYKAIAKCIYTHGGHLQSLDAFLQPLATYGATHGLEMEIKDKYTTASELSTIQATFNKYGFTSVNQNLRIESFYKGQLMNYRNLDKAAHPDFETNPTALTPIDLISNNLPSASQAAGVNGLIVPIEKMQSAARHKSDWANRMASMGLKRMPWGNVTVGMAKAVGADGYITDRY